MKYVSIYLAARLDQKSNCDKFYHKGMDNQSFEMDFDQHTSPQLPLQLSALSGS